MNSWFFICGTGPTEGFLEEKVYEIKNDDLQTAKLALVAHGEKKRWIIATEGIQVGQVSCHGELHGNIDLSYYVEWYVFTIPENDAVLLLNRWVSVKANFPFLQ